MRSRRQTVLWLSAVVVTLLSALLLANAEARYIDFIASLDAIDVGIRWVDAQETPQNLKLHFEVDFHNTSAHTLWVEAINTQFFINGEYAGAYSISEGRYQVPPDETRSVPLQAVLWGTRVQLFQQARASGEGQLNVIGRARVRIEIGNAELKVFYPVRGAFPLSAAPSSQSQESER